MAVSALQKALAVYRQRLLALDAHALDLTLKAYASVRASLLQTIDELTALAGQNATLSPSEFWKLNRALELLNQLETALASLTGTVAPIASAGQAALVSAAGQQAKNLAMLAAGGQAGSLAGTWTMLPASALTDLVGVLSDGSPMATWLDQFGQNAAATMREAMTTGLALGQHPTVIAQALEGQVNVAGSRLMAMVRTNMLDAYRSSSLRSYQENSDVLSSWRWLSAQDDSVCLACLALDGQEFDLSESFFPAHINCRCTSIPVVKGVDNPFRQSSEDWFDALPQEQRDAMLPVWAREPYANGDITLSDFAYLQKDATWGNRYVQGTRVQVEANAKANERDAA